MAGETDYCCGTVMITIGGLFLFLLAMFGGYALSEFLGLPPDWGGILIIVVGIIIVIAVFIAQFQRVTEFIKGNKKN